MHSQGLASRKTQIVLQFWPDLCQEGCTFPFLNRKVFFVLAYQVGLEFIEVNIEGPVKPVEDTNLIKLVLSGRVLPQGGRDG